PAAKPKPAPAPEAKKPEQKPVRKKVEPAATQPAAAQKPANPQPVKKKKPAAPASEVKPAAVKEQPEKPKAVKKPAAAASPKPEKKAPESVKPEKPKAEKPKMEEAKPAPGVKAEPKPEPEKAVEETSKPQTEPAKTEAEKPAGTEPAEVSVSATEAPEAVPAMSAAVVVPMGGVKMGGALPVSGASQKKRKKTRPKQEKKEPELTEEQKKELKRKAEEAHRLEMERIEKEREKKLIESIANIWQSPDFSAGGRVEMNIKTEQRKEIHVTIPSDHEERMKARREAQLAEEAKADAQRRNTEEEARIAAATAALEQMEEPEIPPELLKRKPKPKPKAKAKPAEEVKTEPAKAEKTELDTSAPLAAAKAAAEVTEKTINIEATKIRDAAAISAAISAAAAEAVEVEERTREMSAVIPSIPKETPDEKRRRREAAEAALKEKDASKPAKGKKKSAEKKAEKSKTLELAGRKYAIANIVACCAIFFGIGVFLVVCKRESGFIQSENRNLAEKPTLSIATVLDGSYFEDITKWYTDTIPGREQLKPFSSGFEKLFGLTFNDVKITGDLTPVKKETLDPELNVTTTTVTLNTDFGKKTEGESSETTKKTTKKKKQTSEELADVPADLDDGAWMGNVVVSGKGKNVRAMSAFYGQFSMGEKYADTINRYREDLGSGINIYTLNMPSSSAYYMPKNLAKDFTSQQDCITNIGNNLAGIINVDTYPILESHKDEYIYSRTDHHWQPLGAYYAAKAFSVMGSFDFPELDTYEEYQIDDFVGTMYAYSNYDEELANNPDTFIYHKPDNNDDLIVTDYDRTFNNGVKSSLFFDYASGVNCYSAILGTDDQITEIETGENTGRTLVIIKDSFGNALVPYLTHGFDKIYVIDFRYFEINAIDFINDVEATDLLFAVSIGAAHTESHINAIGNLRIQS
ncbi:MAG: hypothetical protein IJ723_03440, partial [Ruminococcus sp.]|nr:hypothetical protein [Ruminococcus sp.]